MFLEVLSSIAYKNNILGGCINTFSDRVAISDPAFHEGFNECYNIHLKILWHGFSFFIL